MQDTICLKCLGMEVSATGGPANKLAVAGAITLIVLGFAYAAKTCGPFLRKWLNNPSTSAPSRAISTH